MNAEGGHFACIGVSGAYLGASAHQRIERLFKPVVAVMAATQAGFEDIMDFGRADVAAFLLCVYVSVDPETERPVRFKMSRDC